MSEQSPRSEDEFGDATMYSIMEAVNLPNSTAAKNGNFSMKTYFKSPPETVISCKSWRLC